MVPESLRKSRVSAPESAIPHPVAGGIPGAGRLRHHHAERHALRREVEDRDVALRLGDLDRRVNALAVLFDQRDIVRPDADEKLGSGFERFEPVVPGSAVKLHERQLNDRPSVRSRLERALDQVDGRVADQRCHVAVRRFGIEPVGGIDLRDLPVLDHGDALADAERLKLIRRGVDRRRAELPVEPLEFGPHVVAELRVEIGERLVEEEEPRLADDGAPDGEPLLLAAA